MHNLVFRPGRAATAACVLGLAAAPAAAAAPVSVTVRVEGASQTIHEGSVTTDGHDVTTASGGTHKCDGTNGNVNPEPGPTATAALDDAARIGGFTWDGTYSADFDDYLVSRIGPDSQTQSQFWALLVDSQFSQVGGCQQRVAAGDEVLWAFDGFSKQYVLRISAPGTARTGEPVTVRVTDGRDGSPQAGANVRGAVTGADGRATLTFDQAGIYLLKAERPDSIRSNGVRLCVDPQGADPCTSSDRTAPRVQLVLPTYASETSRGRTFTVAWQGDDEEGSGVASYDLDVRQRGPGQDWRSLVRGGRAAQARFRGESGSSYEFRVAAKDRAANKGAFATDQVIVPIDDRDRRLMRFSHGWRRLERQGAWGRFVVRSRGPGASARVRFQGTRVALIGRRLPRGGRLRLTIDGRSKVLRLRGASEFRRLLYLSAARRPGTHSLRLTALGGGPVEVDAVAPVP